MRKLTAMQKRVRVVYFALLAQERKLLEEWVYTNATTTRDLYLELKAQHGFRLSERQLKVALNDQIATWDSPLSSDDTVLLIPPVAGG